MKMFKRLGIGMAAAMLSLSVSAGPMTIGFDDGAGIQDGTVSWGGGFAPLVGAGIDFYTIDGTGTPLNSGLLGALDCVGCVLSFETGAYSGADGLFGDGGFFTVIGQAFDGGGALVASGNLLEGIFTSDISAPIFAGLGDNSGIFLGFGTDTKHQGIVDYFGLSSNTFAFANTEISLGTCASNTCVVTNADIDNLNTVPIVGTAALMPFGLFGLALARRRKLAV
jgi:hypothetical protein